MSNPIKVKIDNEEYLINTDFRVALECNRIGLDATIGEYEKALAVIYKLFGDKGLGDTHNHFKLLELAKKYLACGKEAEESKQEPDMDFEQDYDYILASFMSDYQIDLNNIKMHWWTFFNLLNGLSNSEFGSCCILSRIRNLRNYDTSNIKDTNEKMKIEEMKSKFALKKKTKAYTPEQLRSLEKFNKLTGIS